MHLPEDDPIHASARHARAAALGALAELVDALNGEDGCPWDRQQTPADVAKYLAEECRELADAVAQGDDAHMAEEWGDVAFLVLFFATVAERAGVFTLPDAVQSTVDKMVGRHPHVFAAADVDGLEGIVRQWQEIKAQERAARDDSSVLGNVPPQVSALRKAHAMQRAVADVGFDWADIAGVWDKVEEEVGELRAARQSGDPEAVVHELGDLQFALVNLQRHLGLPAEQPLNRASNRFARRFRHVERLADERGLNLQTASLQELDALWDEAKATERAAAGESHAG